MGIFSAENFKENTGGWRGALMAAGDAFSTMAVSVANAKPGTVEVKPLAKLWVVAPLRSRRAPLKVASGPAMTSSSRTRKWSTRKLPRDRRSRSIGELS
jgi:hypothetical protein